MTVLLDLFIQFGLLAFVAFGGATALLPELHRLVVVQRHWLDETTFNQLFAIAQAAPGPNVLVVTLIGWEIAGLPGAIVATVALALPMSIVIFLLFRHWDRYQGAAWRSAIQTGIAPLAVGLVWASGLLIMSNAAGAMLPAVLLVLTVALSAGRLHPLFLIALGALVGGLDWV